MTREAIVGLSLWLACCGWGSALAGPVDDARAALAAQPDRPESYEALGREQLKARDFDGAIATYQALVEAHPTYQQGRYRLAFTLRKAGRFEQAARAYRDYNAAAPTDPDGYFGLARTLEALKDPAGARAAYARYVELEKRDSEAEWVAKARARMAEIDAELVPPAPPAPGPLAATPAEPPGAPPAAAVTPPAATPPAATPPPATPPASTVAPPAAGPAARPSTPAEALLPDSPLAAAAPAPDPDRAFAAGEYASAANGYLARAASGGGLAAHYRAAVAAVIAGDMVTGAAAALAAVRGDPANGAAARLARATVAERHRLSSADVTLDSIDAALRDGRLRTAARLASRALPLAPDARSRAALSWARGRALAGLGRFEEALLALKSAAAVFPADPDLWADLAAVAERRGDGATARSFRTLAASVAPGGHPLIASESPPAEAR